MALNLKCNQTAFFFFFFFTPLLDLDAPARGLGLLRHAQAEHAVGERGRDRRRVGVGRLLLGARLALPRLLGPPLAGRQRVPLLSLEPHLLLGGLAHAQLEDAVVAHLQLNVLALHAGEVRRDLVAALVLRHVQREPTARGGPAGPALAPGRPRPAPREGQQPEGPRPVAEEVPEERRLQRVPRGPALEHHQRHRSLSLSPPLSRSRSLARPPARPRPRPRPPR